MGLSSEQRKQVEEIIKLHGYTDRKTCEQPRMARPAPEAMAVDVYTTVRQAGFKLNVLSDYDQKMDRFAFLMVH